MIVAPRRSARASAAADLPAAVGPQMIRRSAPAKAALELIPRQMNDRRASMDVVRRKRRAREREEERAHLALRQHVSRLDRRLACHGRGELLVSGARAG